MIGKVASSAGVYRANARHLPDFTVALRPSRCLLVVGGAVHVLAAIAVLIAALPIGLKVVFSLGLALSLAWFWACYGLRRWRNYIARITWVDGRWRLENGVGALLAAELIDGYSHPSVVILNFRLETKRRRSLTLLPDSTDPDSLRRLRVFLRIRREAVTTDSVQG